MDVDIIGKRLAHGGVACHVREHSQLDLRVIRVNQHTAVLCLKEAAEFPTAFGTHGDILQIGLGGADTPRPCLGLVKGGMDTSVGGDLVDQRIAVGRFELGDCAIFQYFRDHRVQGQEALEHLGVRRIAAFGLFTRRQIQILKQRLGELLG